MAEIIRLPHAHETIVGFLRRRGPHTTAEIAGRFCQDIVSVRAVLGKLEKQGEVTRQRQFFHSLGAGGYALVWRVKD